jgi:WD40 repeat protein
MAVHTQLLPQQGTEKLKNASCRTVAFSSDGQRIYTGGSAGDLCAVDAERACTFSAKAQKKCLWRVEHATGEKFNPLSIVQPFVNSKLFATGDDAGGVRVWDERICGQPSKTSGKSKRPHGCVLSWQQNEDFISDLEHSEDGNTLLATSADGRLSVFDLRMARDPTKNGQKSYRLSDDQDDELLSVKIMKNGKKVVCGTQEGVLSVFSWGTWGDCSDRFPGHPSSIDALLKVDEDTLLTGSSDGWIRVVQIHPDKVLGVLGEDHGGFPIEKLDFNSSRDIVGSVSHDNFLRLWDSSVLHEGSEGGEQEEEDVPTESKALPLVAEAGSDDDWEDMDEEEEDDEKFSDSDSDDSDDGKVTTVNDQRKDRLKTEQEKFFDDM